MISSIEQLAGKKVLFATISTDAHIDPLTGLAKYLQDCGCDVRWYASKYYTAKFHELYIYHYTHRQHKDVHGENVDEIHPERTRITDRVAKLNYDMTNILAKPAVKHFEDIRHIYEVFPFDILIVDNMFTAAPIVRKILGVPVIAIGVIPLTEASRDLPPYGLGMTPSHHPLGRLRQAILRFLTDKILFKQSYKAYEQVFRKYGISTKGVNMLDSIVKHADLVLQIGTPGLEYQRRDMGSNIRYIGALLPYSTGKKGIPWFDERLQQYRKVVLVTQGRTEKDVSKIIIPALEAFRDTNVLTIVTTGGSHTAALRALYPYRNVIIEDYIPFNEVMPYADAFITNGGYGGVLLSLKNRLPIIAAGTDECKNETCARIGYMKYGINLHTESPGADQISEAFDKILDTPLYKTNISRLMEEFNQYDPIPLSAGYVADLLMKRPA
ncbi:glycosyltransferase [Chitinophaga filiformis]|uniref:UDP:flavonoid glycosyltransferase YjiC, YdhE family n=1 Tax=Chitinophaga filiformis TaxID=104663 RepID=A0A1G7QZL6_CHIFI|nr:nucleotide disphospho-sugar-binding domain-containing protein [Chitinophaga filiformis]SDG03874.1 UDP:flavonoid glycosyltransferase YjiC, YdhE family [Chitinophaga filiformis]